jgi:hypothetical protein
MRHKSKESLMFACLSSRDFLWCSHDSYILDKQTCDLCVSNRYVAVSKGTSRGNEITYDQSDIWQVYPTLNICRINQSCEECGNYPLGPLYSAQLLAYLSNMAVVGAAFKHLSAAMKIAALVAFCQNTRRHVPQSCTPHRLSSVKNVTLVAISRPFTLSDLRLSQSDTLCRLKSGHNKLQKIPKCLSVI